MLQALATTAAATHAKVFDIERRGAMDTIARGKGKTLHWVLFVAVAAAGLSIAYFLIPG